MKPKRQCVLIAVALCVALYSSAHANLILFDTYNNTPESTDHIVSVASDALGVPLTNLLRLDNLALPGGGSPFTVDYFSLDSGNGTNPNNAANISWNLAGSGAELLAVYVFGGTNGANLYKVTDAAQMIAGSAIVHTPLTGNSGKFATISHILFLGAGAPIVNNVPEGGATIALFGIALALIGAARRRFS